MTVSLHEIPHVYVTYGCSWVGWLKCLDMLVSMGHYIVSLFYCQLLSIDLWAFMDWRDNRLLINESDGVTSSIQLSAKKGEHLWKPNFVTWFMKSLARREALEDLIRYTVRSDQTILYVTG